MIAALLLLSDGCWRPLAIRVRLVTWGRLLCQLRGSVAVRIIYPPDVTWLAPLFGSTRGRMPSDIFATLVDCWATILVQDFIRRHGKPIYTGGAPL